MNQVDAAVIRDLRKATAVFQARTLEMLMTTQPYERPPMADMADLLREKYRVGPYPRWLKAFLGNINFGDTDQCWEWKKSVTIPFGYGRASRGRHKIVGAHRMAWDVFVGEIPDGLWVLHKCDNPPCCNPAHLFLGDRSDNMEDMYSKNRHPKGERHGRAKITLAQAVNIKKDDRASGKIAAEYGISRSAVRLIKSGKNWKSAIENIVERGS